MLYDDTGSNEQAHVLVSSFLVAKYTEQRRWAKAHHEHEEDNEGVQVVGRDNALLRQVGQRSRALQDHLQRHKATLFRSKGTSRSKPHMRTPSCCALAELQGK